MASLRSSRDNISRPKYIYELPYLALRDLARILDDNNQWKELGGVQLQYDVTTLNEFGRTRSPTESLLSDWGQKNHTITELFFALSKMQHYRALEILKPYVDEKYHSHCGRGLSQLLKSELGACAAPLVHSKDDPKDGQKFPTDSCNFNSPENERSFPSKKLTPFGLGPDQPNSQPIPIARPGGNSTKNDNLQPPSNANGPSPRVLSPSPQPGPVNSPQQRRDSESSAFSDISSASAMSSIPPIDEAELAVATSQWSSHFVLGKGGFGTVYRGTWKNTQVAIKRMENKGLAEANIIPMQQSMGELRILNAVRHDNILPLYGYSLGGDFPCLVYQFMPNGSLEDRLLCRRGTQPLNWEQRLNIARGTARGLQFLHTMSAQPLIHGDIKSANILLDKNMEPKIGDFGLAREGPQTHYTHIKVSRVHGTRPYLPDEYLRGKKISTKVDTYSFGIVLYELGTGLRAFDNQREKDSHYLRDHVQNSDRLSLQDVKAGQQGSAIYLHLMNIGDNCSATSAKNRPEMVQVLKDLDQFWLPREVPLGIVPSPRVLIPVVLPTPVVQSPSLSNTVNNEHVESTASHETVTEAGIPAVIHELNMTTRDTVQSGEGNFPDLSDLIQPALDSPSTTDLPDPSSSSSDSSSSVSSDGSSDRQENVSSPASFGTTENIPTRKKNLFSDHSQE